MKYKTETLADALPRQIDRVMAKRDRWIRMAAEHPEMASSLAFTVALMQHDISVAVRAAASGDVIAMMTAYENLTDYDDD